MECKKEKNLAKCNCSYACEKRGVCCECIAHHRSKNELPACYFSKDAEKSYDRSIERYLSSKKQP